MADRQIGNPGKEVDVYSSESKSLKETYLLSAFKLFFFFFPVKPVVQTAVKELS